MAKDKSPETPPVLQQEMGTLEVTEGVFRDLLKEALADVAGIAALTQPPSGRSSVR